MVLSFPFSLSFGVLCVVGSLVSLSSSDWLGVWLGLEVNLMGFVPLILQGSGDQGVASGVKYFVVQSLGSGFLLLGGFSVSGFFFSEFSSFGALFLFCFLGLVIKLGVAPFHWWVPSVMGGLGWFSCGFLVTWQKLAPFFLLAMFCNLFFFVFLGFGVLSSLVGGISGIGQVQVRLLMAYSSISHWGWIVALSAFSLWGGVFYYFFYVLVTSFLFYFLSCVGVWRLGQVGGVGSFYVMGGFLSLAGIPPLSGFLGKWIGIQVLIGFGGYFLCFFLILGAVLSLYYYLSFLFVFFLSGGFFYSLGFNKFYRFGIGLGLVVFVGGFPFYEVFYYVF